MNLQESVDAHFNMMLDNAHNTILTPMVCFFCLYMPVRKLKVTQYCPEQSYYCPGCKKSYWIPPKRKR